MKEEFRKYKSKIILVLVVLLFFYISPYVKRPLKDIHLSEIESIVVAMPPRGGTVLVEDEDQLKILISALNQVEVFNRTIPPFMSLGQPVEFIINFNEARTLKVIEYGSYMKIGNNGYNAMRSPSQQLSRLANELLGTGF